MLPFVLVLELGKLRRGEQTAGGHSLVGVGSVPGRRRTHTGVPVDLVLEAGGKASVPDHHSKTCHTAVSLPLDFLAALYGPMKHH